MPEQAAHWNDSARVNGEAASSQPQSSPNASANMVDEPISMKSLVDNLLVHEERLRSQSRYAADLEAQLDQAKKSAAKLEEELAEATTAIQQRDKRIALLQAELKVAYGVGAELRVKVKDRETQISLLEDAAMAENTRVHGALEQLQLRMNKLAIFERQIRNRDARQLFMKLRGTEEMPASPGKASETSREEWMQLILELGLGGYLDPKAVGASTADVNDDTPGRREGYSRDKDASYVDVDLHESKVHLAKEVNLTVGATNMPPQRPVKGSPKSSPRTMAKDIDEPSIPTYPLDFKFRENAVMHKPATVQQADDSVVQSARCDSSQSESFNQHPVADDQSTVTTEAPSTASSIVPPLAASVVPPLNVKLRAPTTQAVPMSARTSAASLSARASEALARCSSDDSMPHSLAGLTARVAALGALASQEESHTTPSQLPSDEGAAYSRTDSRAKLLTTASTSSNMQNWVDSQKGAVAEQERGTLISWNSAPQADSDLSLPSSPSGAVPAANRQEEKVPEVNGVPAPAASTGFQRRIHSQGSLGVARPSQGCTSSAMTVVRQLPLSVGPVSTYASFPLPTAPSMCLVRSSTQSTASLSPVPSPMASPKAQPSRCVTMAHPPAVSTTGRPFSGRRTL